MSTLESCASNKYISKLSEFCFEAFHGSKNALNFVCESVKGL